MTDINALDALSDPTRRKIFERLRSGPCSVSELVLIAAVSQPAVSQHLNILRAARLVRVRPQAQKRIYSIDPAGVSELRAYVDSFWDQALGLFQQAAEKLAREETEDEQ
jgi:DNA-binding transcriptional ArsR family regulator